MTQPGKPRGIKRYDLMQDGEDSWMEAWDDGCYVFYDDHAPALDQARREGWEIAKHESRKMILDDAYAITFQTMGQYRTQMAKNVANLKYPEGA